MNTKEVKTDIVKVDSDYLLLVDGNVLLVCNERETILPKDVYEVIKGLYGQV